MSVRLLEDRAANTWRDLQLFAIEDFTDQRVDKILPVTGAWRSGDPVGPRRFVPLGVDRPFVLEGGGRLRNVDVAYETWGELDADGSNAVLVCHALTGDSHVTASRADRDVPTWWEGVVGPGGAVDTDRYFVVCVNVLGGCQGTAGPASIASDDGRPFDQSRHG